MRDGRQLCTQLMELLSEADNASQRAQRIAWCQIAQVHVRSKQEVAIDAELQHVWCNKKSLGSNTRVVVFRNTKSVVVWR